MVNKGAIALGSLAAAGVLVFVLSQKVGAAPLPPTVYKCPYCGAEFATYEELAAHVATMHPAERLPLPIEWE